MNSVKFQLIDVDYKMLDDKPLLRLIGKTLDNRSITVFFTGFYPYFYIEYDEKNIDEIQKVLKKYSNLILKIELVEKFRPIGYTEKKQKFIKVTLKDPSKVPILRDEFNRKNIKTYEADILFKYRFMCDYNLYGMKWYEAIGDFVNNTQTAFTELKFEAKEIKEANIEKDIDFKVLSLDIEVICEEGMPNPNKHEIAIISLYFSHPYKNLNKLILLNKRANINSMEILKFESESEMLKKFIEIVREYDPDIIVGYNIINFDLPYIKKRFEVNNIPCLLGRVKKPMQVVLLGEERYKVRIVGRVVVDIYQILKDMARKGTSSEKGIFSLKRMGLDDVSKKLLGEGKVFVDHSKIFKLWNGNEKELLELLEYASKDSELAYKLFLKLKPLPLYIQISRISGVLLQDSLEGSESIRIENILLREFNRQDYVIPNKPTKEEEEKRKKEKKKLKGAIVFEPKPGIFENVIYLDFKSLYPSLVIQYNLCTTTLIVDEEKDYILTPANVKFVKKEIKQGIIPKVLFYLISERDRIKKALKNEKDEEKRERLNAQQLALKILANAFYGYSGFHRAKFFVLDLANSITAFGRYWITKIKEIVENELKREVIYGDTDSVMIKGKSKDLDELFNEAKILEEEINKRTPEYIKVKNEGIFKTILFLTKKRYAGYLFEDKENGKLIFKGIEVVRRDWCPLVEEVLSNVLNFILIENNTKKAFEYVQNIIEKLRKNEIEIEKLAITKTLTKPINKYKGQQPHVELVKKLMKRKERNVPGVGDRISYVIVAGPQKIVERAELPEYVKMNKIPIDSNYYIFHQILPPLERILEAIGYGKSQLLNGSKQLSLLEISKNFKKEEKIPITELIGIICSNCNTVYRRVPLNFKCDICNSSDFQFYSSSTKSKYVY